MHICILLFAPQFRPNDDVEMGLDPIHLVLFRFLGLGDELTDAIESGVSGMPPTAFSIYCLLHFLGQQLPSFLVLGCFSDSFQTPCQLTLRLP